MKTVLVVLAGIIFGIIIGVSSLFFLKSLTHRYSAFSPVFSKFTDKQVIGFLPYWLLSNAKKDYSPYITNLTYFGLRIDTDGSIFKLNTPQEEEPGWYTLSSGKLNHVFRSAKQRDISLSLLMSAGGNDSILTLIGHPVPHAQKLISEVNPLLNKYNFSDLNLDIEYVGEVSDSARSDFTTFVRAIRDNLDPKYSLTIEITGDDLIKKDLINASEIGKVADHVVIMAYDYHYPSSVIAGAVAPLSGAGVVAENDVVSSVEEGLKHIPPEKIILGLPLYGYGWETLLSDVRTAVIPETGEIASNHRAEDLTASCATCSAEFSQQDQEMRIWYRNKDSGTIQQLFYPDRRSTMAKINLANEAGLGGLALWALGYDGKSILDPLRSYK